MITPADLTDEMVRALRTYKNERFDSDCVVVLHRDLISQGTVSDARKRICRAINARAAKPAVNPHCGVAGCPGGMRHAHDPADWSGDAGKESES